MMSLWNLLVLLAMLVTTGTCFIPPRFTTGQHSARRNTIKHMVEDENVENDLRRDQLKLQLLQLGASYDRGFGASPRAREKMEQVITELESLNQEKNASRFISGPEVTASTTETSPLSGNWRMVWTTAQDVLVLGASPLVTVGAIYQLFDPPVVTNVIDLLPRIQFLVPPALVQSSLLRAKVLTRASPRKDMPMRVGLVFEKVALQPVEFLGRDVDNVLPPFGFDLPKLFALSEDVGFFDVTFLDADLLIIQQNAPGGLFVLTRVDDIDP
jgi:hypothetical protein